MCPHITCCSLRGLGGKLKDSFWSTSHQQLKPRVPKVAIWEILYGFQRICFLMSFGFGEKLANNRTNRTFWQIIYSNGFVLAWVGETGRVLGRRKRSGYWELLIAFSRVDSWLSFQDCWLSFPSRVYHADPQGAADLRRLRDNRPRPMLRAPYTANAVDFSQNLYGDAKHEAPPVT